MLDVNSSHNHEMRVSGFELYGEARHPNPLTPKPKTSWGNSKLETERLSWSHREGWWQVFLDNPVRAMLESPHRFVRRWGLDSMTSAIAWHQANMAEEERQKPSGAHTAPALRPASSDSTCPAPRAATSNRMVLDDAAEGGKPQI